MNAKEYLNGYGQLKKRIEIKKEGLLSLRCLSQSLSSGTGLDIGGIQNHYAHDKISAVVAKIIDLENETADDIERLINLREEILSVISGVENPTYANLLEHHYINGLTLEQTSERMNYSFRHINRLHIKALEIVESQRQTV